MNFLEIAVVFIFGAIVGSFLNVVIYRYNSGTSPLTGRSLCFACGKTLSWRELIPLLSFLIQRARCLGCKTKLSWQYPLVEAISGFIFVAIFLLGKPPLETLYLIIAFSSLLVITVYDMRHQIIPDGISATFALLALLWYVVSTPLETLFILPHAWTLLAGPILFFPFWFLWMVSKGRWIGLGDGKIAWGMGWFLGLSLGASAVMLAFWIGAVWALGVMGVQKLSQNLGLIRSRHILSLKSEIPFGPFLILATCVVYFTGINLFDGSLDILSLVW